ncbi:MAG: hypothetical protein II776_05795 [Clostridia bacterium]|nr:hypothetical protein [Clostridia bacterium]
MARNLAQLLFLAYCAWMLVRSHRVFRSLLLVRMDERELEKKTRGLLYRTTFMKVKKRLAPLLYWWNLLAVGAFALDLAFQLLLGWFDFAAVLSRILNSLALLLAGGEALVTALIDSLLRYDTPFVLYRWDPDGDKIFSSGILDVLLFFAAPVAIVFANFLAL